MNEPKIILTLFTMILAVWLVVETVAAFHRSPKERDTRPLVMPAFCGIAYFLIALPTWMMMKDHPTDGLLIATWQVLHSCMLGGMVLCVRKHTEGRQ